MKVAAVVNPIARQGKSIRVLPKVREELESNFEVQVFKTDKPGDGVILGQSALSENCRAVVVIGGDGTISEVASALAGSDFPLGVIHSGTANVLANEAGIPRDVNKACEVIREGKT